MADELLPQDLSASQDLLDELFKATGKRPGVLGGGQKLEVKHATLQALRETHVSFGHPRDNFIHLTPALFEGVGVQLTPIRKQQLEEQFDFYYLTLSVSMQPAPGAQFTRVECSLDFGPKGADEPIVQSIFPTSAWREVLNWGGGMSLGLNGDLGWSAGVDTPAQVAGLNLPAQVQANIANKNDLKASIVVPEFAFKLGRSEIAATGEGNSRCFWRVEKPELQEAQTANFGVVFKVPKGTSSIELTGLVAVEPSMNWLVTSLQNVFDQLSAKLQALLRRSDDERSGEERLPIGDHETWTLALPQ